MAKYFKHDFDDLILKDLFDQGITDEKEFIQEFMKIKEQLPQMLERMVEERLAEESKIQTRAELEKLIDLQCRDN